MKKKLLAFVLVLVLATMACSLGSTSDTPTDPGTSNDQPANPGTSSDQPASDVLFKDDFSSTGSGWDRQEDSDGLADYADGAYRLYVKTSQMDIWANPGKTFPKDVVIDVDATTVAGPQENDFGIVCRYTQNSETSAFNLYYLVIGNDGYAAIVVVNDSSPTLLNETTTTGIIGTTSNHIQAKCIGSNLTLTVNGEQVLTAQDSSLTGGDVGLIAGTFEEAGVDISFDNFVVTKP